MLQKHNICICKIRSKQKKLSCIHYNNNYNHFQYVHHFLNKTIQSNPIDPGALLNYQNSRFNGTTGSLLSANCRTQTGYEKSGSGVGSYYDKSGSGVGTYYGKSGSGVGSYYGKGVKEDRHYLPEPGYRSPCGVQKPNCPYGPQEGGTRVTSGTIDSGSHHKGVTQSIYNPSSDHSDNSKGTSSGWSYMREDDADRHPPRAGGNDSSGNGSGGSSSSSASNRDRNREQQR